MCKSLTETNDLANEYKDLASETLEMLRNYDKLNIKEIIEKMDFAILQYKKFKTQFIQQQ